MTRVIKIDSPFRTGVLSYVEDVEQAAREMFYALSQLEDSHPATANIKMALRILKLENPEHLGLSRSVLKKRR